MLASIAALVLLSQAGSVPALQPQDTSPTRSVPFAMTRLDVDLRVDYEGQALRGSVVLHLRNASKHGAIIVPLILGRLMTVSRISDGSGRGVRFHQGAVLFRDDSTLQVNSVEVRLRRKVAPGDSVALRVTYAGVLVGYTETGSLYIQDRVSRDFTILRVDAFAFPQVGVPEWSVNREAAAEAFLFSARVEVPQGLTVAAGGRQVGIERHDSTAAWQYQSTEPVPFLNITIAPYRVLEYGATTIFHFPEDSSGAGVVAAATDAALRRYADLYGPLGRQPHLTVIEIPEGFGSQASLAAGIIQTADAFRSRAQLRQVYHELSHLWNVPDRDRPSPRWNEGLATFLQWRLAAELDSGPPLRGQIDRTIQSVLGRCKGSGRCASTPMIAYGAVGATDLSYSVGMLMFDALYQLMRPEAFDRTYRTFFQRYRENGATTADLVAAFRASDERTSRVFDDWLTTSRWYGRLSAGESMESMIAEYAR